MKIHTAYLFLLVAQLAGFMPCRAHADPAEGNAVFESPPPSAAISSVKPESTEEQAGADAKFKAALAAVYHNNPQLNSERDAVKILDEKVSQANAGFRPTLLKQSMQMLREQSETRRKVGHRKRAPKTQ